MKFRKNSSSKLATKSFREIEMERNYPRLFKYAHLSRIVDCTLITGVLYVKDFVQQY